MDKLQRAGRDFLLRLIAQHGLDGAGRILRRRRMNSAAGPSESRQTSGRGEVTKNDSVAYRQRVARSTGVRTLMGGRAYR